MLGDQVDNEVKILGARIPSALDKFDKLPPERMAEIADLVDVLRPQEPAPVS